jgi:hypothetical protein
MERHPTGMESRSQMSNLYDVELLNIGSLKEIVRNSLLCQIFRSDGIQPSLTKAQKVA